MAAWHMAAAKRRRRKRIWRTKLVKSGDGVAKASILAYGCGGGGPAEENKMAVSAISALKRQRRVNEGEKAAAASR